MSSRPIWAVFLIAIVCPSTLAERVEQTAPVDFQNQILPILRNSCLACHNRTKAKASLVLESPADILKGGDSGPAVAPGNCSDSLLFKAASHDPSVDSPMPPPDNKVNAPQLTTEQLGLIRQWIEQGARGEVRSNASVVWKSLPASVKPIYTIAVAPDGRWAACGRGNEICIYSLPDDREIAQLADPVLNSHDAAHRDLVESLAISPDGSLVASGSYREVKLWHRSATRMIMQVPAGPVAASSDGKTLAVGGDDGAIEIIDAATGKQTRRIEAGSQAIRALCLSADAKKIAAVCGSATILTWDLDSGDLLASAESPSNLNAIAWISGAKQLAGASDDGLVRIWELSSSQGQMPVARELKGHRAAATSLTVNPKDDSQLLSGSADGTARLWDTKSGRELRQFNHGAPILAVAFSGDGKRFASAGGPVSAAVWNIKDGKLIGRFEEGRGSRRAVSVAFSTDQRCIATAGAGPAQLWEADTLQPINEIAGLSNGADTLAFCGTHRIAAGRFASGGELWDLGGQWTFQQTIGGDSESSPFADRVTALDFSPDGRLIAAGGGQPSRQGEIVLLSSFGGQVVRRLDDVHSDTVFSLRFSPDGRQLASGSADKLARITDVKTGQVVRTLEGHASHVLGVAWSADGHTLATAGADNTLRFWNADTGATRAVAAGFDKEVTAVCFLGRTDQAIAASGDQRLHVTNTAGQALQTSDALRDFICSIGTTPDGSCILAGGQDGILRLWDVRKHQFRPFQSR